MALDSSPEMIKFLNKKNLHNVSTISDYLSDDLIHNSQRLIKKFDLIIASSVCGFLPDYEATLRQLKYMLKTKGMFIQWDWLSTDETSEVGLTENRVKQALKQSGFSSIQIKQPFVMNSSKGSMPVIMAIAKNS